MCFRVALVVLLGVMSVSLARDLVLGNHGDDFVDFRVDKNAGILTSSNSRNATRRQDFGDRIVALQGDLREHTRAYVATESSRQSAILAQKPTPKLNQAQIDQTNKEKELYFLRAQYYQYLKSQARALENRTRNGAFVGVVLGASNMDITLQRLGKPYGASISPFAVGVSGGYMHFIDSAPLGIRFYGQYLTAWNSSNNIQDSVTMQLFSFNLDMFGDLAIADDGYYLGAYAGVGGGLAIFDQSLKNVYEQHQIIAGSVLNLGLSATLAYHHRLEAGVKVPPSVINENFAFRLIYLVSYQYLF